ncbi:MAG: hypothetical protein ACK4UJ_02080 [Leptonema sp. (in: bacteria)]
MELSKVFQETQSLFSLIVLLWGLFSILNLFHSNISLFWRISSLITFVLFLLVYFPYIQTDILSWKKHYAYKPLEILESFIKLFPYLDIFLYLTWCYSLIKIFFSAREKQSQSILKFLVLFTLVYWILSFVFQKKMLQIPYKEYYQSILRYFGM